MLVQAGWSADYKALEGVQSLKTVFDFRDGVPESALVHIQLVHDTYKDKAIHGSMKKPEFVVIFMASSVKLLSSKRDAFSAEERKALGKMDQVISAMSQDGIRLEVCSFAVNFFGIDLESIAPEIHRVSNGWISSMGYQAQGYSLVPSY
jgi:intracellular sulfur oxidation DsrE/DsrF family protein